MTWVHFQRYIVGQMNSTKFPRIQGVLYSITLLAACGQSPGNIPTTNNDAGTRTQTSKDAAQGSAVIMDAAPDSFDAAVVAMDAETQDAMSTMDTGSIDAGQPSMDTGLTDAVAVIDAETADAMIADTGPQDTGLPPPCLCDDGLYCNGLETCDAMGQCIAGTSPSPIDDGDPCTLSTTCNEMTDRFDTVNDGTNPNCVATSTAPITTASDYAYWYWPKNHRPTETWPAVEREMHFLTGHYGLAINEETGEVPHLGILTDNLDPETALFRPNASIEQFAPANLRLEVGEASADIFATTFEGDIPSAVDRAQMIDGGRYMNRINIPNVSYAANNNLSGQFQIASMPRHLVLTHSVTGSSTIADLSRIRLSGQALGTYSNATWTVPDRALTLTSTNGEGWHFIVYAQANMTTSLTYNPTEGVSAEGRRTGGSAAQSSISLLLIPTTAVNADELAFYLSPQTSAQISSTLLDKNGNVVRAADTAEWDPSLGAFRLDLRTLQEAGAPNNANYNQAQYHNWYGRHRIEVDTLGSGPMTVPLAFFGSDRLSWYITGGVAMLRDPQGEPLGIPVQISKNWHGQYWYHFYAHPTFAGVGAQTMEFTVASSRWGSAYAASHAQLSLAGYNNAGGHWDESALGAFGESITYDPDVTLGRAMVDDVRPFLVQSDQMWNWTGNVGGADFLRYKTQSEPYWIRRLSRVRSHYGSPGPNLTDVVYAGITTDGRIQAKITTQLGATDDLVRVYYHLEYNFLADTPYSRLAFFQMAADRYGDNLFTRYAYGNAGGVIYDGVVNTGHNTTGYESVNQRGIAIAGDAPWVMLYDNQRDWDSLPEQYADLGFIVRHFEANIGTVTTTTTHINIHRTRNQQSQYTFELGLPHETGSPWCGAPCQGQTRFIPAGSTVKATVEYVVPPADASRYYGTNQHLQSLPASAYQTTDMVLSLARGNELHVSVSTGTLSRTYPIEIEAVPNAIAAEFSLNGGLGYTPISFHGLNHHDGWRLERRENQNWVSVGSPVHGNDYWQSAYDSVRDRWTQTFSVPNQGMNRYRLVWKPPGAR